MLREPFLLPVGNQKEPYAKHFAELKNRQDTVARLGAKYGLPVVHFQAAFDAACAKAPAEHWAWDEVYSTYAGRWLIAEEWLKVVGGMR